MSPSHKTSAVPAWKLKSAVHQATSILCGADFELASAAKVLEDADHPAAAEAEALFKAALTFRHRIEAERDDRPADKTTTLVLYVARCSRCDGTYDGDGSEYQATPEQAIKDALGEYGEFERRDGKLVCPACCLAEDDPDE